MTIADLEQEVIFEYYCILDLFWENVSDDREKVFKAVKKAKTRQDLHNIIGQYI